MHAATGAHTPALKQSCIPAHRMPAPMPMPQQKCMDDADATQPPALHCEETLSEAIERATILSTPPDSGAWLRPSPQGPMKLNAERWQHWGETPDGAAGPVDWKLRTQPAPAQHPNHPSALQHAAELCKMIDQFIACGMVEMLPPGTRQEDFVTHINPFGARVKPNGTIRMLCDSSITGVNASMEQLPLSLPTVESIAAMVRPHHVLGKRDLSNGFYHCVLSNDARRLMGFRHPATGQIGRWVVLPQGATQSPAIFCAVTEAAARIFNRLFQQQGIKAFTVVYVDDYIIIADNHDHLVSAFAAMDAEAALLGLEFNPAKDVGRDAPLAEVEVLGLLINPSKLEIRLPESKRLKYAQTLADFKSQFAQAQSAPRKALEQLAGKLVYASRCTKWGMLFLQEVFDCLFPGMPPHPPRVILTNGVWSDLAFWEHALGDGFAAWGGIKQRMLSIREVTPTEFPTQIYSDASTSYGMGGVKDDEILSLPWPEDLKSNHIGTLELEAAYQVLSHWAHDLRGQHVLLWIDNTQALSAINKGASRIPECRAILHKLARLGLQYGFEVRAKYIKSKDNPADAPSRGVARTTTQDWTFRHFARFNNPPAVVDCCAAEDGYNAQPGCTEWYSATRPVQDHVDQLVGKVLWANIPFAIIGSVIDTLVAAWRKDPLKTLVTVVVPEWQDAGWYRKYLRRHKPLFHLLHRYPAGSRVFLKKNTFKPAPPCPFPLLVLRLGSRTH